MRALVFEGGTWEEYEKMRSEDGRTHKKLCKLIKEMLRNPTEGLGKPKQLKHELDDAWSRRINEKDRVVYTFTETSVNIFSLREHYSSD